MRRPREARETKTGKGEIMEDANAGAPAEVGNPSGFGPQGQAFPAISDDRVSRRNVT